MTPAGDPPLPRFILTDVAPGVALLVPAGLQIGDALVVPEAVHGRWITIGAGDDQDIVLRDEPRGIGRSHCRMIYRDGAYRIQGRLHPAGHALNGERFFDCTARPLKDGDLITIGKNLTLQFRLSETDA
jgi:predicted component of type VI protein secretion system